jgi:hypothetical protein
MPQGIHGSMDLGSTRRLALSDSAGVQDCLYWPISFWDGHIDATRHTP